MIKRFLLVFLCFIFILGTAACSPTLETQETTSTESNTATESNTTTDTPTDTESESSSNTEKPIETKPSTEISSDTTELPETDTQSGTEAKPETESSTNKDTAASTETGAPSETNKSDSASIKISGENRYKVVYAESFPQIEAKRICNRLLALDKTASEDNHYQLVPDTTPSDGSPEILVGLTNRAESSALKDYLDNYLDFAIAVLENKIVIYANTEERIKDAIQYFFKGLEKRADGVYYTPTTPVYTEEYTDYTFTDFTIANTSIKKYSIITPSAATNDETTMAKNLQTWIAENTGALLPIKADSTPATAYEIIVGAANRTECSQYSTEYRNLIYYSIETKGTKLLFISGTTGTYLTALSAFKDKAIELKGKIASIAEYKMATSLSNKKAIFIGNSFIYWGNCVNYINYTEGNDVIDLENRLKGADNGYFKQVCKANNIDMTVYNFTYGGKNLEWIYTNKLSKMSSSFFADIDYVFISEAGQNESTFKQTFNKIKKLFTNAEEVVYLAHEYTFSSNATYIINALPDLAKEDVKIVPWGKLVYDVYKGNVKVPGSTMTYNKNSFIKNSSGAMSINAAVTSISGNGDTFHQNPLSGYITAQMCFTAISGCSAQGQKYDFCWDSTLGKQYDLSNFLQYQYNNGQTSNFIEIFNSKADMAGLQKLMDDYILKYN